MIDLCLNQKIRNPMQAVVSRCSKPAEINLLTACIILGHDVTKQASLSVPCVFFQVENTGLGYGVLKVAGLFALAIPIAISIALAGTGLRDRPRQECSPHRCPRRRHVHERL